MKLYSELLFYFILCFASGVTCLEIRGTKYVQAELGKSVNVKCGTGASERISSCQFRIWFNGRKEAADVINITGSKDPLEIRNLPKPETSFTAVSSGTDFSKGDCGVTLTGVLGTQLLIGCKLTTQTQDSHFKTIPLFFTDKDRLGLINNSEEKHVKIGEDVSFELKTKEGEKNKPGEKLSKCSISKLNGVPVTVESKPRGKPEVTAGGRYKPWLKGGECGFTISNLTESDDRTIYVVAEGVGSKSTGAKVVTLIFKHDIEMKIDKPLDVSKVGDRLKATCRAHVEPGQDLVWSWELGGQPFGVDNTTWVPGSTWRWPWESVVVSDSRVIELKEYDYNEDLTCKLGATHEGKKLNKNKATSTKLNFHMTTAAPNTSTTAVSSTTTATTTAPTTAKPDVSTSTVTKETKALLPQTAGNPGTYGTTASAAAADQSQTWKLTISPAEVFKISKQEPQKVQCKADPDTVLSDCGFSIDTEDQPNYFNASQDWTTGDVVGSGHFVVKNLGLDLDKGECGIEITATEQYNDEPILVGCRARTERSGWKYNYTYGVDTSWKPWNTILLTEPSWPFLLPGSSLKVKCDYYLPSKVQKCSFTLPGQEQFDIDENHEPQAPHWYRYEGKGLNKGQCGIFIPDVSTLDTSKGNKLTCEIMISRTAFSVREIRIIEAAAPAGDPRLSVSPGGYTKGPLVSFECVAPASRPPASLSWYLGLEPVSADKVAELPAQGWRWWRDSEATTQTVTLNLTRADEGKQLTCVLSHMALKESRNSSIRIEFPKGTASTNTCSCDQEVKCPGNVPMSLNPHLDTPDRALIPSIVFAVVVTVLLVIAVAAELLDMYPPQQCRGK